MIWSYLLFTTPTCPNCPAVKTYLFGQTEISGKSIDATTPDGRALAGKFEVFSVPTVILLDEGDAEVARVHDVAGLKAALGV